MKPYSILDFIYTYVQIVYYHITYVLRVLPIKFDIDIFVYVYVGTCVKESIEGRHDMSLSYLIETFLCTLCTFVLYILFIVFVE